MTENIHAKRRGRPANLSRDDILQAALSFAKREGLARLSMRELAQHMGRSPMSLYAHIDSKEDLLIAMLDSVLADLKPAVVTKARAKAAFKKYLRSLRKTLNTVPGLGNAAVMNGLLTAPMLDVMNTLLMFLSALDKPLDKRVDFCRLLIWVVLGFTASEELTEAQHVRSRQKEIFEAAAFLESDRYSYLIEAAPLLAISKVESVFDLLVDLLAEGIWAS